MAQASAPEIALPPMSHENGPNNMAKQGQGEGAVVTQPGAPQGQWMPLPQGVQGCPPGLEYLTMVDQLLCHQKVELIEVFTAFEARNRFLIKNSMGQQIFFAYEESGCCMRYCCRQGREFTMHIQDNNQQEVMRVYRPFKCCSGCCWCADAGSHCSYEADIEAPPGTKIASVHQTKSCCNFEYIIKDLNGEDQLKIVGPCCCIMNCQCIENNFQVVGLDGQEIGVVQRQWSGLFKEWCTSADNFGVTFPMNLDIKMKAALVGAMFLIDMMAYENTQN